MKNRERLKYTRFLILKEEFIMDWLTVLIQSFTSTRAASNVRKAKEEAKCKSRAVRNSRKAFSLFIQDSIT